MRRHLTAILPLTAFALSSCQPAPPLKDARENAVPHIQPVSGDTRSAAPETPKSPPALWRKTIMGIEFEGVGFDSRSHRLRVIDQPLGPGSAFVSAEEVAGEYGALLAINAGFFTPEGKPLGLVVTAGKRFGSWNSSSSLGSGIFAENASGGLSIFRRGSPSAVNGARELLQAGPLLVENRGRIGGLDADKVAVRSIVLNDGGHRWWIGRASSCTLAALGAALSGASPAPWPVGDALNLDGGRSTDLFVSGKIPGGPINRRTFLNRPVRNFLILTAL